MPITQEQRRARRRYIGSSDSPALVGVDPWRNAVDVYVSKVHELEDDDEAPSDAAEIGNDFENPLIDWTLRQLARPPGGGVVQRNVLAIGPNGIHASNLDAVIPARAVIEAKCTSLSEGWGDEGSDEVPDRVMVQSQHHLYCTSLDEVLVPVLTAPFGRLTRRLYRVRRHEELIAAIVEIGEKFWRENVEARVAPEGAPNIEVVRRIVRRGGKVATVSAELVAKFQEASANEKAWKEKAGDLWAEIVLAAGDAEIFDWGDPRKVYSFREVPRRSLDVKALRVEHPEVADEYERTTYSRSRALINR